MSLPFSIYLRVDPARGNDNNNDGSDRFPLQTLQEAFRRCELGWRTTCKISLAPGTYDLGKNPTITIPTGAGVGAEPMLIVGDLEDSGLGSRVIGASSLRGGGVDFGTVMDSAGGLVTDAWRGWVVEFVSGNPSLVGKQYMIASNTASAFTVVDSLDEIPVAGDKFVIKRPASSVVWSGNFELSGTVLGLANMRFDGPGGAVYTSITQLEILINNIWFTGIGSNAFRVGPLASLKMIASTAGLFSDFRVSSRAGAFFQSATRGAVLGLLTPSSVSLSRSVWHDVATAAVQPAYFQCLGGAAFGASHFRFHNNSLVSLVRFRFSMVLPAPTQFGLGGATVLLGSNAVGYFEDIDVSGCIADPIAGYDGATLDLLRVSGSGNVGVGAVGVRMRRGTVGRNLLGNTITATLGDTQVGTLPTVTSWALLSSLTTDQSASPSEFCQIGP